MILVTSQWSLLKHRSSFLRLIKKPASDLVKVAGDVYIAENGDNVAFEHESLHRIPEESWRRASQEHAQNIHEMLSPGLTPLDHPLNVGLKRQRERMEYQRKHRKRQPSAGETNGKIQDVITALDPKHPVYNFLIEYYGLKGTKGVRRLLKWSFGMHGSTITGTQQRKLQGGILLEGATEQDFLTRLHTKGAALCDSESGQYRGIVYSPLKFVFGNNDRRTIIDLTKDLIRKDVPVSPGHHVGPLAPFMWYRSLLEQTLNATPILHCYGLHEWAMQYQPSVANYHASKTGESPLPPSSKYQSHLNLRIERETLNKIVETNTLICSHVDAWKYFAKDALPINQFIDRKMKNKSRLKGEPAADNRPEWLLQSEQPACVHTTMDLLKIALKLGPFCDPQLLSRVLSITIEARILDVAASPYDVEKDYGIEPIRIETPSGRSEYKRRQIELMKLALPIRKDLIENYDKFLSALCQDLLQRK